MRFFISLSSSRGELANGMKCLSTNGSHRLITLDERKQKLMDQVFREYQLDRDPYIRDWIMRNITEHQLAISLRLGWSPVRVAFLVLFPLVLSLAVGFWYMARYNDAQTAWTIASYIVTASGGERTSIILQLDGC